MERNVKVCKDVVIKSVSSLNTIQDIAEKNNLDPTEVFVRITFEYEGEEYQASQRLGWLGENNYTKLVNAKNNGTTLDLEITAPDFFSIYREVSLSDLFKNRNNTRKIGKSLFDKE